MPTLRSIAKTCGSSATPKQKAPPLPLTTAPLPPPSRPPRPSFIRAASETRPSSTQQPQTVRGEPVRGPRRAVSNHTAPATNRPRPSPAIPASSAGTQHPDHCQPTNAAPTSQPSRAQRPLFFRSSPSGGEPALSLSSGESRLHPSPLSPLTTLRSLLPHSGVPKPPVFLSSAVLFFPNH